MTDRALTTAEATAMFDAIDNAALAREEAGLRRDEQPATEPKVGSCPCSSQACTGRCPECGMHETQRYGHNVHYGEADAEFEAF